MLWYIHQNIMQNFNSIGYKYRYVVGWLWKACLCVSVVTWCLCFLVYYGLISITWESFSENIISNVEFKMLFCCFSLTPWNVCFYTPRGGCFTEGKRLKYLLSLIMWPLLRLRLTTLYQQKLLQCQHRHNIML